MATVLIIGLGGAIETRTIEQAAELASTLLFGGYDVRINSLSVRIEYGPGYDTVVWAEGSFNDRPVTEN